MLVFTLSDLFFKAAKTPPGMQSASLEAMKAKHIATMAYAKKLEDEKFDPADYPPVDHRAQEV
ncbi:MAG: hypothetical protein SGPRY_003738 [Prymnesium sp.]